MFSISMIFLFVFSCHIFFPSLFSGTTIIFFGVMFVIILVCYLVVCLPQIESKIFLALGGVTLVMLSIGASLGFYGYVGVPATLFVIEVSIPSPRALRYSVM